ncbi:hypothetical protein [Mucilaginibacter sp.]|uniref:hypothetical protein n=1 Tax=Mucilaginibacter sp. TaxID=1882438 RepID=UPI00262C7F45|nr:hypothetical protein [Mucilaginibacter sp.]
MLNLFFSLLPFIGFGQSDKLNYPENKVADLNAKHKLPQKEKLYLHLDRAWYKPGDTIWYKAYLLNENLSASIQSGLLYIEMRNDSNRVVKRQTIKAHNGLAIGDIVLKETLSPGNYILHAYTNWMRNFGPEHFFSCQVTIAPTGKQYWLINRHQTIDKSRNVNLGLHFSDLTPKNIGFRDLQLSVLDRNSTIVKSKVITDPYGNLNFKFTLPDKKDYKHLFIQAEDNSKYADWRKIIIPLQLTRPANTDLQFMPEGGSLLADQPNIVGFKAIDEEGKGVAEIKGEIYNNAMQQVASFQSTHKGMGSFTFIPQAGETYTAKVTYADSIIKNYPLPGVKNSGIAIRVAAIPGKDFLELHVVATADIMNSGKRFTLIGQARDSIYYEEMFSVNKPILKIISTKVFPTGIAKFILLDAANQPVTRRMIFIDHNDELNIKVSSNKANYAVRDSVSLQLYVTDATGKPVKGNFSLAVTDDNEVKASDAAAENMVSYMLLRADIKGNIEDPAYYFTKKNKDRLEALDNLLLTQGWASYDWDHSFGPPPKMEYEAEPKFTVKGSVSNVFNKPIANTEITLKSEFPPLILTTQTDKKGCFSFTDFPELEKIDFMIQATRDFNIGLNVNEVVPPDFDPVQNDATPWYVNSDSTFVSYVTNSNKKIITENKRVKPDDAIEHGKSRLLKEVVIRQRHYNPPPAVHLLLDEEDLRNIRTGKKPVNLMKLLNQKEKLNQMYKMLIIDETPYIRIQELSSVISQGDINRWLESYDTNDILDMRVERMFLNTKLGETPALCIYITSNSHMGADMAGNNGYAYRPIPISQPHQFYSPQYVAKATYKFNDWRATIHWAPEIETDDNGKATVSFFTADRAGTYSLILEGGDMKGNVGYQRQQLSIGR